MGPTSIRRLLILAPALLAVACSGPPSDRAGDGGGPGGDSGLLVLEPADNDLRELAFMTGHWASRSGDVRMEEHWTQPAAGSMLGQNRVMSGERTIAFEFLRIVSGADGVVYLASPGGQYPPTPFALVEIEGARAVFENPEHDFPRRITYWLDEEGALNARIDGLVEGEQREEYFRWQPARLP